jgi:DME family drug/metabolite transporter
MKLDGPPAVVGAAMLWGTAGTAGALAVNAGVQTAPVSLAAARLVIGGLLLASLVGRPAWALLTTRRGTRGSMLLAAVAAAAYQLLFFAAVSRAGVAVGTIVAIGSAPVFTGLLAWLFDGARPTRRWAAATAAAVAGCTVLITGGDAGAGGEQMTSGIVLALLGGFIYALYAVIAAWPASYTAGACVPPPWPRPPRSRSPSPRWPRSSASPYSANG